MSHRALQDKRPRWGRLIAVLVIFGLLIGGGYFAYKTLWSTYGPSIMSIFGKEPNDYEGTGVEETFITIYEGEFGVDVANSLEEADVVKDANVFYKLLLKKPDVEFLPGSYRLKTQMSAEAALESILDPENKINFGAALREGLTVEQTFSVLSAGTGIPIEKFRDATAEISVFELPDGVESLEGWLFPANYEFEPEANAQDILMILVNHQKEILAKYEVPSEKQLETLTVASIIEKEAGIIDDFAKVSAVIQNRLETGMKLAMDSTAQFGVGEHENGNVWSSNEALTSENPWNTYVHEGLPVGPIANPGEAAIKAALEPADGNWLFFVVAPGGTGASTFSETLEEHDEAVFDYQLWCEETTDSGC